MGQSAFRRSWRGYNRSDVEVSAARDALRVEQLEFELEGMTQRANAMQIEIRQLHARVDELRTREASLARSLDEVRERRELIERESEARAKQTLLEAEERASALKTDGLRQVGELQRQVEQLLGMRTGLTQAMQRLAEDIAGAMARIAAAPATSIDRPIEDQVERWSENRD